MCGVNRTWLFKSDVTVLQNHFSIILTHGPKGEIYSCGYSVKNYVIAEVATLNPDAPHLITAFSKQMYIACKM